MLEFIIVCLKVLLTLSCVACFWQGFKRFFKRYRLPHVKTRIEILIGCLALSISVAGLYYLWG